MLLSISYPFLEITILRRLSSNVDIMLLIFKLLTVLRSILISFTLSRTFSELIPKINMSSNLEIHPQRVHLSHTLIWENCLLNNPTSINDIVSIVSSKLIQKILPIVTMIGNVHSSYKIISQGTHIKKVQRHSVSLARSHCHCHRIVQLSGLLFHSLGLSRERKSSIKRWPKINPTLSWSKSAKLLLVILSSRKHTYWRRKRTCLQ